MAMIDITSIAESYTALGLTVPADIDYAVGIYTEAQTTATTPAANHLTAGVAARTLTRADVPTVFRQSVLDEMVNGAYGRQMQGLDHECTRVARAALSEDYGRVVKELADRFVEGAQVVRDALEHFRAEDFGDPKKILMTSEAAGTAWHAAHRALGDLEQIRSLIVRIDSNAINSVAHFVDLGPDATADTLPLASGIYHGHAPDSWVRILAVPGIVPALHDRDGAAAVSRRAAELLAEAPKERKMRGQW